MISRQEIRGEISMVHITIIYRRELPEITEKMSRPTKCLVTSHVTDLDIFKFLIMVANEEDSIVISLRLLVGSVACGPLIRES